MIKIASKSHTILQNNSTMTKYERKLHCKQKDCLSELRIVTFYQENLTYLWVKRVDHLSDCKFGNLFDFQSDQDETLKDPIFKALVASTLPPKVVIKTYNNDRKTKNLPEIPHSEELARKISKLRFD